MNKNANILKLLCLGLVLAAPTSIFGKPKKFSICGMIRTYSPKLSILVVPKSLATYEVERYEIKDNTGTNRLKMTTPWWICVTEGQIERAPNGNLSHDNPGILVINDFSKDQTSLEMGIE